MKLTARKNFFANFNFLKTEKEAFLVYKTLNTDKIRHDNRVYMFSDTPYTFRELGLIMQVRSKLKNCLFYEKVKSDPDVSYRLISLKNEIQYNHLYRSTANFMLKRGQKEILMADLNNAYSSIALLFGFIDLDVYKKLLELKEYYKTNGIKGKNINFILGAGFLGNKIVETWENGRVVNTEIVQSVYEGFWWFITLFCDKLLRRISFYMRYYEVEKSNGKKYKEYISLCYFVDGIFLNVPNGIYDVVTSDFQDSFEKAFEEVYNEFMLRFQLSIDDFSGNPFTLGYKWEIGSVDLLKPEDNFARFLFNGRKKPFHFSRRENKRFFD